MKRILPIVVPLHHDMNISVAPEPHIYIPAMNGNVYIFHHISC